MTKELLAAQLNGREIGEEISKIETDLAAANRLLVVYGASDDLVEFEGILRDETGAPGTVRISRDGVLLEAPDRDEKDTLRKFGVYAAWEASCKSAITIKCLWNDGTGPAWTYKTDEPHATFDVMEDGEVWCKGLVIQL